MYELGEFGEFSLQLWLGVNPGIARDDSLPAHFACGHLFFHS